MISDKNHAAQEIDFQSLLKDFTNAKAREVKLILVQEPARMYFSCIKLFTKFARTLYTAFIYLVYQFFE